MVSNYILVVLETLLRKEIEFMEMITEKDLIPGTNYITTKTLLERFGMPLTTLKSRMQNHKDDMDKLGTKTINAKDFESIVPKDAIKAKRPRGPMIEFMLNDGSIVSMHTARNYIFTKEAANYLLSIDSSHRPRSSMKKSKAEVKSDPEPVNDSLPVCLDSKDDDKQLVLKLAEAFSTGDTIKMLDAALKLDQYRIQTISALHAENERLKSTSTSLISWSDRASVSRVVRELTAILEINKNDIWNKIYYKLTVDYKLPLEERRKMPLINAVEYTEWKFVYKALYDICDEKCMDLYRVLEKADVDAFGLELIFKDQHADV